MVYKDALETLERQRDPAMQGPTHSRLHVRDTRDAHTVFEAVRKGLLRPIRHRLSQTERSAHIHSGAIFVWEESDDETGLKRWTDGRVWTQSRMREVREAADFLYIHN